MKKIRLILILLCCVFFSPTYAAGGITHMFIAKESAHLIPDPKLRHLLLDNMDPYLVGAYYPDSGNIDGTYHGEDSHWDPFIYTFANYLKEKYRDPAAENPQLVAFLFGCAAHRVSDEVTHWTFYKYMREKDFHGDVKKAHSYGDRGIDLLLITDKAGQLKHPALWWVPVDDLLEVYKRMHKPQYTKAQILWGNSVISVAGLGERIIAPFAYPILQWKMPWTARNYYAWPQGGILEDEQKVIAYQLRLWKYLYNKRARTPDSRLPLYRNIKVADKTNQATTEAIQTKVVEVETTSNTDGSVVLQPILNDPEKFKALLKNKMDSLDGDALALPQ